MPSIDRSAPERSLPAAQRGARTLPTILEHFGLNYMPFSESNPSLEHCFMSRDMKQTISMVDHAAREKGISILCGDSGHGVTYAQSQAALKLHPSCQTVRYIPVFHVTERDLYKETCRVVGASMNGKGRQAMITGIRDKAMLCQEQGHPLFLVYDHAENIPDPMILDLPALVSGGLGFGHMMTVLLCGTRALKWRLECFQDVSFRIHFSAKYTFSGLTEAETKDYIRQQFTSAGATREVITAEALDLTHSVSSSGNYKELNSIMRDAMRLCLQTRRPAIDKEILYAAVSNQKL